jgi:xylose isomerase
MALMNGVETVGYLVNLKKLSFLHLGSQIKAQFDNDFPPLIGPEGLKETVQLFWALMKTKWKGVVEYDCHMLRTEADPKNARKCRVEFVRNCTRALSIILELAARLNETDWTKCGSESEADLQAIMKMCGLSAKTIDRCSVKR